MNTMGADFGGRRVKVRPNWIMVPYKNSSTRVGQSEEMDTMNTVLKSKTMAYIALRQFRSASGVAEIGPARHPGW